MSKQLELQTNSNESNAFSDKDDMKTATSLSDDKERFNYQQDAIRGHQSETDEIEEEYIDEKSDIPPDGGYTAWMAVAAASTIMAMTFGMCNTFGIYQTYYEETYISTSSNVLSIIGALQAGLTFGLAIFSTVLMYYIGVQSCVAIGGIVMVLSFMFLSITNAVWQIFLVQGLMYGIGSGLMYVHSTSVTMQYFHKKKALAVGIITACSSLAGVYWPIGIDHMINKLGFPWANRVVGFIYIPMTILSAFFLKPRIKPPKRQPGDNIFRIKLVVWKDWKYLLINISWFISMLSLFPGLFYLDLFCIRANVNPAVQAYNVPIMNACALVFRVIPGLIADKIGRMNILIPSLVLSGIFSLALWIPAKGTGLVVTFLVLWSSASSVPVAIFPAVIGQLFQNSGNMFSYLSFFYVYGGVSSFIGPIIAGNFIPKGTVDNTEGFDKLAIFCGVMSLVSAAIMIFVRTVYAKKWIEII